MTEQVISIIVDTPLSQRKTFDEALANLTAENRFMLRSLDTQNLLRGDWRRAAVRKRLGELMRMAAGHMLATSVCASCSFGPAYSQKCEGNDANCPRRRATAAGGVA